MLRSAVACLLALVAIATPCVAAEPVVAPSARVPLDYLPSLKGDYFQLDSRTLGRPFHIYVRLPPDYRSDSATPYPIVYLLDGDSLFPMLAPLHLLLTYDENLPEAVIVGIAYGSMAPGVNRRDLDYVGPSAARPADQAGAPAFQTFLKSELLPRIEVRYRVDPAKRILLGQSLGANFVLHSAFTEPDLFWGRIASNPVFQLDRERFFGPPPRAERRDLSLIVISGSRDRRRDQAVEWFNVWKDRETPWALYPVTIEGGTHAADIANAYRLGMLHLFQTSAAEKR